MTVPWAHAPMDADVLGRLLDWAADVMSSRPPDRCIGGEENPYLQRWHVVPRNPGMNLYLHRFLRDDDDRALHDHPWPSRTLVLAGGYTEVMPFDPKHPASDAVWREMRRPGDTVIRGATDAHRVVLHRDAAGVVIPAITLFQTGPVEREWGFHCPQGWVHWQDFTDTSGDRVGKGCG